MSEIWAVVEVIVVEVEVEACPVKRQRIMQPDTGVRMSG
jgi:hypothetical protein